MFTDFNQDYRADLDKAEHLATELQNHLRAIHDKWHSDNPRIADKTDLTWLGYAADDLDSLRLDVILPLNQAHDSVKHTSGYDFSDHKLDCDQMGLKTGRAS